MTRREFITLLGGAAAAWPRGARAQQGERMRRIGVLMGVGDAEGQLRALILRRALQELGLAQIDLLQVELGPLPPAGQCAARANTPRAQQPWWLFRLQWH